MFKATVKLVNKIGFAASSVAKIAKEAKVSPATIYVYHKNKEDLLVSTYMDIKVDFSQAILENFDDSLPIRDILRNNWYKTFEYISNKIELYQFTLQFDHSPYISIVDQQALEQHFTPIINVLKRGVKQKIIKNVGYRFLTAFMVHPIFFLANPQWRNMPKLTKNDIETTFKMGWDAIKL